MDRSAARRQGRRTHHAGELIVAFFLALRVPKARNARLRIVSPSPDCRHIATPFVAEKTGEQKFRCPRQNGECHAQPIRETAVGRERRRDRERCDHSKPPVLGAGRHLLVGTECAHPGRKSLVLPGRSRQQAKVLVLAQGGRRNGSSKSHGSDLARDDRCRRERPRSGNN